MVYLENRRKKAKLSGEGYGVHVLQESEPVVTTHLPHPGLALVPLINVLAVTLILQKFIFPHWDISSWATDAPYRIDPKNLIGTMNNWALMIALMTGIVLALTIGYTRKQILISKPLNLGATGSLLAVMNTASEVGFGNVIKSLPGFQTIAQSLMRIQGGGSPLLSEAVTVNALAGVTGSASGGMSIALDTFGKEYSAWAARAGVSPELLHRVASMASGGMDTLPHNGAVITLFAISGMTHRQSYKDIFAITLIKSGTVFLLIGLSAVFHFV